MAEPEREWVAMGDTTEVPVPSGGQIWRVPDFDPRTGEHLWTWNVMYRANPARLRDPDHTPMLDGESLLAVLGPGCYYCEEVYSPRLAHRRCRGKGTHKLVKED